MSQTRVLYVIDSLQPSGAEWSLLAMVPHLLAGGLGFHIVHFGREPGLGPHFEELGVPVSTITIRDSTLSRVRQLRSLIRETDSDLVHTTLFQADIAGRIAGRATGVPVVSSLVNTAYRADHRTASGVPRWKVEAARALDATTARLVTRFHAISRTVADEMGSTLHIDRSTIDVVPRGRDPSALGKRTAERRADVRASLGLAPDVPVLLTAARHEPQKALDVAIEAFETVHRQRPETTLLMAGRDGRSSEQLRAAISSSSAREAIRVLGWRADVPDLLAASDVFLFTSRWEGLGSVLIEAMALEIPIVTSDLPVVRELLVEDDEELAWFAPVGDASTFADRCLEALAEPGDRTRLARARFLRRYTAEEAAAGVRAIYDRVLAP